ncbi:hypothetical protein [Thalassospira sp. TSL5-1]|uniref:hypothetical protein n=1 Tax=Thalassospira sp. TSL5-1 TaxID=1544451 RepID=UPI000B2EE7BC|nr:hypothetical protein [Thalassospira sp. TSL5-1]
MKPRLLFCTIIFSLAVIGCSHNDIDIHNHTTLLNMNEGKRFEPDQSRFNFFLFLRPENDYITRRSSYPEGLGWEKIQWGTSNVEIIYRKSSPLPPEISKSIKDGNEFYSLAKINRIPFKNFTNVKYFTPTAEGWIGQNGNCIAGFFSKRLKSISDDSKTYTNVAVRISACSRLTDNAKSIVSKFKYLTTDNSLLLKNMYIPTGTVNQTSGFPYGKPEISGSWSDIGSHFKTTGIRQSVTQVTFSFQRTKNGSTCTGNIISFQILSSGNWEITCSNGDGATGTWITSRKSLEFIATGLDKKEEKVQFKINY